MHTIMFINILFLEFIDMLYLSKTFSAFAVYVILFKITLIILRKLGYTLSESLINTSDLDVSTFLSSSKSKSLHCACYGS